ncbi:MAG: glutaminyl-peptide cyclotransferase [Bacteroidota bacterium]|nr:glutaminyl-peptide cyclotransferase [Bacteroidota bacterium]
MFLHRRLFYFSIFVVLFFVSCDSPTIEGPEDKTHDKVDNTPKTPIINYSIVNTLPHDSTSFTEGFLINEGQLFESTGAPENLPQTKSLFGSVDLKTGKINVKAELDRNKYFGEGICFLNNKVFQLTYKNQIAFVYDAKTFKPKGQFNYLSKEGWGLTTDGKSIIMSDGTNNLTYLNPETYQITKTLSVSENNFAVDGLNELEYIKGFIYANIYTTHYIVKINPETGNVVARIDIEDLFLSAQKRYPYALETNGIAYDSIQNKIYVTGKMWPCIYEIKFPL